MPKWADIPGFEGRYRISSAGTVWSIRRGKALSPDRTKLGYLRIKLGAGPRYLLHRLVLLAFVGPSPMVTNHKNGKKDDNRLRNLEYCTPTANNVHAIEVLGLRRGEAHSETRFTDSQVRDMRRLYRNGVKQTDIARRFGTYQGVISNIIRGRSRKFVR